MHEETERKYRNHDVNYRCCHEPAAASIPSLASFQAPCSLEYVNNSKEVDYRVKKHEEDKEKSTYAHDELLGN